LFSHFAKTRVTRPYTFAATVELHWETENRVVWNKHEHTNEDRELVYEFSWIEELGGG